MKEAKPTPESMRGLLPDRAGAFVAVTPVVAGDGFRRRTYALAQARVEITVARTGGGASDYGAWVVNAQGYPPLSLPLDSEQAKGFFTCTDEAGTACDAHIQFRSGFHVEGMGNGRVAKADLDRLLGALNLALLVDAKALPL